MDQFTELDGLVKRRYMNGVKDQQNFIADFSMTIPVASTTPSGLDADGNAIFRFTANLARRQNGGAQNANEQFRDSEPGTKKQMGIIAKINVWNIEMTKFAKAASKGNVTEFASGLDFEMFDAEKSFKKDRNRQLFGIGNGELTAVNKSGGYTASTSIVVDSVQYLFVGMRIDIYNSTTLEASNVKITAINDSTKTLTVATAVTCSDDATIVRTNIRLSAPTDGKEIMGIKGLGDDGTNVATIQGLSRTTYSILKGTVIDASSASITQDLLQRLADKVETASGRPINTIVSNRLQRRGYLNVVTPLKRFNDDNLDSGFSVLSWNGHAWMVSFDCQKDTVYMYDQSAVQRYVLQEMALDSEGGNVIKEVPGYDAFYCYYKSYENLGTEQPNAIGRLESLAQLSE